MSAVLAFLAPPPTMLWLLPYLLWAATIAVAIWRLSTRPLGAWWQTTLGIVAAAVIGALPQAAAHVMVARNLAAAVQNPTITFALTPGRSNANDDLIPYIHARTTTTPTTVVLSLPAKALQAPWLAGVAGPIMTRLTSGGGQWARTVATPHPASLTAQTLPAVGASEVLAFASGSTLIIYAVTLTLAALCFGSVALGGTELASRVLSLSRTGTRSLRTAAVLAAAAGTTATLASAFTQEATQYRMALALVQRSDAMIVVDTVDAQTALTVMVTTPPRPPRIDTLRLGAAIYVDTLMADTSAYLTVRQLRTLVGKVPFSTGTPHLDTLRAALFAAEGDTGPGLR